MTSDLIPQCAHCGRATRFSINGEYRCKQGCDRAAAEEQAMTAAQAQLADAQAAVAEVSKRITMPAPEPPPMEEPPERAPLVEQHPELAKAEEVPVVQEEPEPKPAVARPRRAGQRKR